MEEEKEEEEEEEEEEEKVESITCGRDGGRGNYIYGSRTDGMGSLHRRLVAPNCAAQSGGVLAN